MASTEARHAANGGEEKKEGGASEPPKFGLPSGMPPTMTPPSGLPPMMTPPTGLPPSQSVQDNIVRKDAPKQLTDLQRLQKIQKAAAEKDQAKSIQGYISNMTGRPIEDEGNKRKVIPASQLQGVTKRLKTTMCLLFEMGGCTKGAMCDKAHTPEELATAEEVAAMAQHGASQASSNWGKDKPSFTTNRSNANWSSGASVGNGLSAVGSYVATTDASGGSAGSFGGGGGGAAAGTIPAAEVSGYVTKDGWTKDKEGRWVKVDNSGGGGGAAAVPGGYVTKDGWTKDKDGRWIKVDNPSAQRNDRNSDWSGWVKDANGRWVKEAGAGGFHNGSQMAQHAAGAAAAMASGQELVVTDPEAAWRQLEEAYLAQGTTPEQWRAFQQQVEEGCAQQGIVRGQWAAAFLASLAAGEQPALTM